MKKPQIKMKKPHINLKGFKASFGTRSFRVGSYSVIATAIVLAILIAVNVIVGALPASVTRIDITANQLYSISEQTKAVAGGLEEEVTVYWIVQSGQEDTTLGSMLEQYESLSSRLKVVKKDPDLYPTFLDSYNVSDVSNNSLLVESSKRYSFVSYNDIYPSSFDYSSYSYTYAFDGESRLTSAIDYVAKAEIPKMYLLTGHGESSLSTNFADAVSKENIETEELYLLTAETVPEDADCVLIYAPQSDISEEELTALQTYLAEGGNLMVITNPPQDGALTNLEALMSAYGVTAAEGIVIEGDSGHYAWSYPYYLLPNLKSHTVTSPLISGGYYVLLPMAQGLQVADALPSGVSVTQLLTTSNDAYAKVAGYDLTTYEKEDGDIDGPFALGVAITDSNAGSKILWVSSAALLNDNANTMISGGNQDLFLNCLNWMCEVGESGITIHAKSLDYEYLTISDKTVSTLTVLMIGVIPLAYLCIGITTRVRRKRR